MRSPPHREFITNFEFSKSQAILGRENLCGMSESPISCSNGTIRKVLDIPKRSQLWGFLLTTSNRYSYLIPFKELFVMDTQEVRSRCFSFEQNLLRL